MKTVISLASLALAFSLHAQMTAVLHRFPARSPEIEIRNDSAARLVAFGVRMSPAAPNASNVAPFVAYVDTAIETDRLVSHHLQTAMPLLPNEKYIVPVPTRRRPGQPGEDLFETPIVTAGIFAGGTTTGDPALLDRLLLRRRNMLQAVELAIATLTDADRHELARDRLIGQFKRMADSLDHWYLPQEQQVGRSLYQLIAGRLINLDVPVGSRFPPAAFVVQEIGALNRQRVVLSESQPSLAGAGFVLR